MPIPRRTPALAPLRATNPRPPPQASRPLSQKTLIIAAGTGIQAILTQVAVNLFLVRIMDSQLEFGVFRQVWLVVNTTIPVFLFGLEAALYYHYPHILPEGKRAFLRRTIEFLFLSGALLAGLLVVGARHIATAFAAPEVESLLRSLAPYVLFAVPSVALFHFLIAEDRPLRAVAYNLLFLVSQSAITVAMIAAGFRLETVFLTLGAAMALRVLHMLWEIRRLTVGRWRLSLELSGEKHLRYALPIGLTATLTMLGGRIDKFVVASFLGPAVFATYSVGAVEFPLVVLLASAAATVIRMRVSALHHEGTAEAILALYLRAFRKLALVLIPLGIWLFIFARELIVVLYTEDYVAATEVFRIYVLLTIFRIAPLEPFLASLGKTRAVFTGGLLFLSTDLALNVLSVPLIGVTGPPIATVVATGCLMTYYAHHLASGLGVQLLRLLPGRVVGRIGLVSFAAAALSLPIRMVEWPALLSFLAGLALFGISFLTLAFLTRTLGLDDLQALGTFSQALKFRRAERRGPSASG